MKIKVHANANANANATTAPNWRAYIQQSTRGSPATLRNFFLRAFAYASRRSPYVN